MKPTFWNIWKLLGKTEDWERVESVFNDRLRHKKHEIEFYYGNNGVAFHSNQATLYRTNSFTYILMYMRTKKFRKAFSTEKEVLEIKERV